jgi:hypothetical protein
MLGSLQQLCQSLGAGPLWFIADAEEISIESKVREKAEAMGNQIFPALWSQLRQKFEGLDFQEEQERAEPKRPGGVSWAYPRLYMEFQ